MNGMGICGGNEKVDLFIPIEGIVSLPDLLNPIGGAVILQLHWLG
jgi:hypothetical protein